MPKRTHNYDHVELYHYGVKGMKWGVRKTRYRSDYDYDTVIKKGSSIQNISAEKERDLTKDYVYTTYTNKDRESYSSFYADELKRSGFRTIYKNDLKVVKDITIPSQKKAVEIFKETFAKDPDGMARCIARTKADISFFKKFGKTFNMDVESRLYRKYMEAGEDWLNTKGYETFNSLIIEPKIKKARNAYFDTLLSKGYSGILDTNDINNEYRSEAPVIVIDPKNNLKRGSAQKISIKEINAACRKYEEKYPETIINLFT